jgi:hypothetical protein
VWLYAYQEPGHGPRLSSGALRKAW